MRVYLWLCHVESRDGLGRGFGVGVGFRKILRVIEVSPKKIIVSTEDAWDDEDQAFFERIS